MKKLNFHISGKRCAVIILGSAILAFGLYNIHSFAQITEGGCLGLELLVHHWFGVSPAVTGFVVSAVCYLYGWRILGNEFIFYSALGCSAYSVIYALIEQFPPLWPELAGHPFWAAVLGAVFVGVGAGLGVRAGCASGGDDALAMAVNKKTGIEIQWIYLITDGIVLALSLTYIPLRRFTFSLLTVVLSGQIIGWVQRFTVPEKIKNFFKKEYPSPSADSYIKAERTNYFLGGIKMERKLRKLFDYQRFEQNTRLSRLIQETENRQSSAELSDDDLFLVAAAGEVSDQNLKKDEEKKS